MNQMQSMSESAGPAPHQQGGSFATMERQRPAINVAAVALRGISEAYDMQLAATRLVLQTQARAAAAFGWPDYSGLFRLGNGHAKRIFSTGAEQLLSTAQHASDTLCEVQNEVGKLIEANAECVAESWQQGLEEISTQAEESLEQMKELARQQLEEARGATESLGDATREAVREGGEKFRETVRQGAERGREMLSEGSEAVREQGEEVRAHLREQGEAGGRQTEGGSAQAGEEKASQEKSRRGGRGT